MEKGSPALTRGVVSSVLWARCSVSGGECQFRIVLTSFAGSILCLSLEAAMWFFDFAPYWRVDKTLKYRLMFAWALFVGVGGIFITGAGVSTAVLSGWMCADARDQTYGSVVDIKTSYESNGGVSPWSCECALALGRDKADAVDRRRQLGLDVISSKLGQEARP